MSSTATTHGLLTLTFGVPTITGYVVQDYTSTSTPGVIAEVFDENGIRVYSRYDDVTTEFTFTGFINGATLPAVGAVFTVGTNKYECLSVETKGANKDHVKVTLKGKSSQGITLT